MWTFRNKIIYILYRLIGAKLPISRHSRIAKKIRYLFAKMILKSCGKNVNIERNACFNPSVIIGNNSGIGIRCELNGPVVIGDDVMMAPDVIIYTSGHCFERTDIPMMLQGGTEPKEVIIGDDVWIGRRAIILPGVHIGKGSVVGAGAVVTKDVPEFTVVAGVPAKVVKSRQK